jgi:hypothetical protein
MTTLSEDQAIEVIRIGVGLLALWLLYLAAWSSYKVDAFRQRLFDLRSDLFDYAVESGLPFDDPAYGLLRHRINRIIRWADQFTAMHFLIIALVVRADEPMPRPHTEWVAALERVKSDEVRARLRSFENRLAAIIVRRLFLTPVGLPFFLAVVACLIVKKALTETHDEFRRRLEGLTERKGREQAFANLSAQVPKLELMEAQTACEDALLPALA